MPGSRLPKRLRAGGLVACRAGCLALLAALACGDVACAGPVTAPAPYPQQEVRQEGVLPPAAAQTLLAEKLAALELAWAPDKRLVLWEIDVKREPRGFVVSGFTDSPGGLAALRRAAAAGELTASIDVRLLPDDDEKVGARSWALAGVPAASLLARPAFSASTLTQALMGTPLRVLQNSGAFWRVQTPDGYLGWVHDMQIVRMTADKLSEWNAADKLCVTSREALVKDAKGAIISPVPAAGLVRRISGKSADGLLRVQLPDGREGFVEGGKVRDARELARLWKALYSSNSNVSEAPEPFVRALIKEARALTGTSYLWGGTSSTGLDCSGFVSLLWRMAGVIVPRDADQQIAAARPIVLPETEPFKAIPAGALLAFGTRSETGQARVAHVALSLGAGDFIHSLGSVHAASLDPASPLYSAYEASRFLGAYWFAPAPGDDPCFTTLETNGFFQSPPRALTPCRYTRR